VNLKPGATLGDAHSLVSAILNPMKHGAIGLFTEKMTPVDYTPFTSLESGTDEESQGS
jgi:hypothetical protein